MSVVLISVLLAALSLWIGLALTRKRRAVVSYARRLRPLLEQRYGPRDKYTPQQVRQTIRSHGFDERHIYHAYVMYVAYHQCASSGLPCPAPDEYACLQAEVRQIMDSAGPPPFDAAWASGDHAGSESWTAGGDSGGGDGGGDGGDGC